METSQHLFKELETAEKLFSDGSIKNAQKKVRNVLKESRTLTNIPKKLKHKLNSALSQSRYFDDISSFATNPKRDNLISKIKELIASPLDNPKKHAHLIHEIQTQWQLLDLSSKPASKSQWIEFNKLTNNAWEPCKEYFNEIKEIKVKNAKEREKIINAINDYVLSNNKKWPSAKNLIIYLQNTFQEWQKFAPVLEKDLPKLKKMYFDSKKPINDEIKNQEKINANKKELLIEKVSQINNEDPQICIKEFSKLKQEWREIGIAGKKIDKILWDRFNKNADKFFIEKKQKLNNEIEIMKDLDRKLSNDEISISDAKNTLSKMTEAVKSIEFKNINRSIKLKIIEINDLKKKDKINAYSRVYEILLGKIEINNAPEIFFDSLHESLKNKKSNTNELLYACIKLEILAGIDSLKKDLTIRNNIQLEMLSNKFNKNNSNNPNDLDSLINHFIVNFSKDDVKTSHASIWKRIIKCADRLIS